MTIMNALAVSNRCACASLYLPPIDLNLRFNGRKTTVRSFSRVQCGAASYLGGGMAVGKTLSWRESVENDAATPEMSYAVTIDATPSSENTWDFGAWRENLMFSILRYMEDLTLGQQGEKLESLALGVIGATLLLFFALANPSAVSASEVAELKPYFGTAASASSYGGYGGNSNKQTTAEYTFQVPQGWKEKTITKIEKGTNGTDAEFDNPKHKEEKVYVTYLANFRQLAPIDRVLENLALSDPNLQDIIAFADGNIKSLDRKDSSGQQYYDYEIDSPVANVLVSVTCAKNKLYAHFVKAGPSDWARDQTMLRQMHESFQTIGGEPLSYE